MAKNIAKVQVSRGDLKKALMYLDWAQSVIPLPAESAEGENRLKEIRNFKYYVGINLDKIHKVCEQTQEMFDAMGYPESKRSDETDAECRARADQWNATIYNAVSKYHKALRDLEHELAEKDEKGEIIKIENTKTQEIRTKFTPDNQTLFLTRKPQIADEHPVARDWLANREKNQAELMDNMVELEVRTFRYDRLPAQVAGDQVRGISFMLTNLPDDDAEESSEQAPPCVPS